MSNQNNAIISNNNPLPDYLDVSSEEEPKKEKDKNREYSEEKYYTKNRRHKSRSRNRYKYHDESRSNSRSHHHRNKHHRIHKENENSYNKYNNLKYSRSSRSGSYYEKENKYHYSKNRNRNYYSKHSDYSSSNYSKNKYKRSHNKHNRHKSHSHKSQSPNNSPKSNNSSYEKYKIKIKEEKKEYKENSKWTDGEKKSEFRQIKIEKYDKNKNNNNNKSKELELKNSKLKEISQLKKDLTEKKEEKEKEVIIEKEKPNFEPSGILQRDLEFEYNKSMNNKILINYNPPSDSIIPTDIWFFFKFTENKKEPEETYKLINKEFFLIGKDPRICDIRIKQKNISRQHAVIQFRKIKKESEWEILPYLIDLNSTNGTYLNGEKIDNKKYYELRDKDELNFGDKKIDFVLMKMK